MLEAIAAGFLLAMARPEAVTSAGVYDVTVVTGPGVQARATLTCRPGGGDHPHHKQACKQLVKARGDIAAIPAAEGVCTGEYAPVTLRARGLWNGTPQKFEKVFSNRCVANLQTGGHLFNF